LAQLSNAGENDLNRLRETQLQDSDYTPTRNYPIKQILEDKHVSQEIEIEEKGAITKGNKLKYLSAKSNTHKAVSRGHSSHGSHVKVLNQDMTNVLGS
jgi:hypothetical protein